MGNEVYLNIETNKGLIMIPFLGIKELDCFTVGYGSGAELIDSLCEILDLNISLLDVIRIYISGDRYKNNGNSSLNYIKYRADNYNVESVREMLSLYLRQDHRRIKYCDVRHVATDGMVKFKGGKAITDREINLAVKAFFTGDYKKQRDMYFLIKDFGGVRIDKLSDDHKKQYKTELSKMESKEDDFYQYLIELASRGEEDLDRAMDELSRTDLEDISKLLNGNGVFDGITKDNEEVSEDVYAIEALTGMSINSLKNLLGEFCNNNVDNKENHMAR